MREKDHQSIPSPIHKGKKGQISLTCPGHRYTLVFFLGPVTHLASGLYQSTIQWSMSLRSSYLEFVCYKYIRVELEYFYDTNVFMANESWRYETGVIRAELLMANSEILMAFHFVLFNFACLIPPLNKYALVMMQNTSFKIVIIFRMETTRAQRLTFLLTLLIQRFLPKCISI